MLSFWTFIKKNWNKKNIHENSERSCDGENWSNGCWKFSFAIRGINCFVKYIKKQKKCLHFKSMIQWNCEQCEHENLIDPKLLNSSVVCVCQINQ